MFESGSRLDCMNISYCADARGICLREEFSHSAEVIIKYVLFIYNILPLLSHLIEIND